MTVPEHQPAETRAAALARAAGAMAIALGVLVLTGWALGIRELVSVSRDWPTMKANSAVAAILLGAALLALADPPDAAGGSWGRARQLVIQWAGTLAGAIGAVTLAEYVLRWNPGFDALLLAEPAIGAASTHPGRMAPETALCFALLGTALALSGHPRHRRWMTITEIALAVVATVVSVASLTSLGLPRLGTATWFGATGPSVLSAVLMSMLGTVFAILQVRREPSVWAFGRRDTLAFGAGLLLLTLGGSFISRSQSQMQARAAETVAHERARLELRRLQAHVVLTQSIANASLALSDDDVQTRLTAARVGIDSSVQALRTLVGAQPSLSNDQHVERVDSLMRDLRTAQDASLAADRADPSIPGHRMRVRQAVAAMDRRMEMLRLIERDHGVVIDSLWTALTDAEWRSYAVISATTAAGVTMFIIALLGLNRTELRRRDAVRELRESEARYRTLIEMSPEAIFVHSGGRITFVNPAAVQMMRAASAAQLVDRPVLDLVHPDSREVVLERMRRGLEEGAAAPLAEERFMRIDGTAVDVEAVGRPLVLGGRPAIIVSCHEITARKQAEQEILRSASRFRTIFEEAPLGVAIVNTATGEVLDVNEQCATITGRPQHELLGMNWQRHTHPDDVPENMEKMRQLAAGAVPGYQLTKRFLRPDGSVVWVTLTAAPMSADDDGIPRHIAMLEDITARRAADEQRTALERQLQMSTRMESVGRLAGGVAHDFNNMLGVILGMSDLALQQLDPSHPIHADLREIQGAARRSADLTRQLLAFARRQVVAPTVLDLNEAVDGSLRMLQRLIGEDIQLAWQPATGLWPVAIDPSQLDQVLTNLCLNARQAIADVGTLTIRTANRSVDAAFCATQLDAVPGEYVCLTVGDTGHGISPEVLAHIFEPFYSTKALGEGTGLGLATVYGAVRQNQGFITVVSAPGRGTEFGVYLPKHSEAPVAARRSGAIAAVDAGQETVLVVEDEPSILRLVTRMLQRQGYTVLGTTNPREALTIAGARDCSIDLLLTDVVMPEMNGRDLAEQLASACPQLRVLFMSGHTADVMARRGVLEEGMHFIAKPFTSQELLGKVRAVLDSGDAATP